MLYLTMIKFLLHLCQQSVDVKKLQGTKMNVETEHGSVKVKAIYAESSSVSSCTGKIELGHVHGELTYINILDQRVIYIYVTCTTLGTIEQQSNHFFHI